MSFFIDLTEVDISQQFRGEPAYMLARIYVSCAVPEALLSMEQRRRPL